MTLDPDLVGKALSSKVAEKAYEDGLSNPLREVSKFVTDCIKTARLALFPVQITAALQDRLENRLKTTIEQVPAESRIIPPSSILVPIINHLSYIEDGAF